MMDPKLAALYRKYLLGELTPQENTIFLDLLTSCDKDDLPDLEEIIALDDSTFDLDNSISDDIFYAITGAELKSKVRPIWRRSRTLMGIAATMLLVGFAFLFSLVFNPVPKDLNFVAIQYYNPTKFVKRVVLEDGTKISLRQGARVVVMSDFETDSLRKVKLSGEAFFEVAKNPHKAFVIVNSGDFDVRVLGTAFNLTCSPQQTRLVLNHGKVQVKHDQQHSIILPGQQVDYDMHHKQFNVIAIDTMTASNWKSDFLSFNQVPLSQIVGDLNNLYPTYNLELIDSFQTESFTGYLPANDLEKSLKILNTAFNQTIIHKK
ncbi:FecR family protein [Sphingobacterium sp. BIGb0165]|uniref:FecR family protein n=1 Tax=Sphingobacterium sp. BIGb0165 TaxID=2940615 RepID=UPI00216A305E|nr:FecR domain-containing protein [Sphingobacterium sp. BIGb0165]MCS4228361.1 ferric-dicitrate binding protein FerR (iron transport regulator) [Sphingobacterium sp. BIGb0165]